ncbi:MAG: PAS domain-containing sensor histidine kinase, partial [Tardiphaga sp.]
GLDHARDVALRDGRAETPIGIGHVVLQRVGSGSDVGLIALIAPHAAGAASGPAQEETEAERVADIEHAIAETIAHDDAPHEMQHAPAPDDTSPSDPHIDTKPPAAFDQHAFPLRFVWQIDRDGHFSTTSEGFIDLIGPQAAALLGQSWTAITAALGLDPDRRMADAMATRRPWTGVTLLWPVEGGRLSLEMSGLPIVDRAGVPDGQRGFGICRGFDALPQPTLDRHPSAEDAPPSPHAADIAQAGPVGDSLDDPISLLTAPPAPTPPTEPDPAVQPPENVVPFRAGEGSPSLTPVENSAFNELARQLSARLEAETELIGSAGEPAPDAGRSPEELNAQPPVTSPSISTAAWLTAPAAPPRGDMQRDRMLLDLIPVGVLVYRLDQLLFANPAFLDRFNYPTLHALEEAGGLDALYVEADVSSDSSTSDGGTAVTIAAQHGGDALARDRADARLFAISWDDQPAHALIFSAAPARAADTSRAIGDAPRIAASPAVGDPAGGGYVDSEDLAAILDTTAEGVIMFDADGSINSCNRSAEALFGFDGEMLTQRGVTDLFASESRRVVQDYIDSIKHADGPSLLDHGREALGQARAGGLIPLSITMGRTRAGGPNFFAVFRDLTQTKKTEGELLSARRHADRAATAKADVLARISHEVRTPLNAIIGFAEVMLDQRFGPLGSERYSEYMKDIRASGERVIAIVNDLLDLSRIESGKLDLAFTAQSLNEMVEQCVAVMQPQANRSRIIIRTSLAHLLPTVVADARALRQITLNLIGNSIHLANPGGQVIVSTALSDFGDVVLRVRDTGHGLNDYELAAAMEPFRHTALTEKSPEGSGVSLSLTRALVEANHARFHIKTAPSTGTLIEVAFPNAALKASGQ